MPTFLPNTELGVNLERHENEEWRDYVDRIAITTLFAAHDRQLRFESWATEIVAVVLRLVEERDADAE